jgi:hypothetical protein
MEKSDEAKHVRFTKLESLSYLAAMVTAARVRPHRSSCWRQLALSLHCPAADECPELSSRPGSWRASQPPR